MNLPKHKIAVASRDGNLIYHFGQTDRFLIYEIDGKGSYYLETRTVAPACANEPQSAGHDDQISQNAMIISDCQAVLVGRIGPGARAILQEKGVLPIEGPLFLDEALKQYLDI